MYIPLKLHLITYESEIRIAIVISILLANVLLTILISRFPKLRIIQQIVSILTTLVGVYLLHWLWIMR
jgi:hypothetical protein